MKTVLIVAALGAGLGLPLTAMLVPREPAAKAPVPEPAARPVAFRPAMPGDGRVARPIDPKSAGIGRRISLPTAKDRAGKAVNLSAADSKLHVIALTSATCPLTVKYGPTLAELEREFTAQGVRFSYLNPTESETPAEISEMVRRLGWKGSYIPNAKDLAAQLGAQTTTEIYVLDARGTLRYRGAVDDQYGIGSSLPAPRTRFLADALTKLLKGEEPAIAATWSPGCKLDLPAPKPMRSAVTYHDQIARTIQRNCLSCHRPGGLAPFSLATLEEVKARAPMIRYVVDQGIMPPWFAADSHGAAGANSPWANDMSLTAQEKAELSEWIAGGMPAGDPKLAPAPLTFTEGWQISPPDKVVQIPRPIAVPAQGTMPYQNVIVDPGITRDTWVQELEIRPTDPRVVHHVLVFIVPPSGGERIRRDGIGSPIEEVNGFFAGYVPGNAYQSFPDGFARLLPAGSRLRFQIHYTPNGIATQDQLKLGMRFSRAEVKQEVFVAGISNLLLRIPPGAPRHREQGEITVPVDVKVMGYIPHMHVRGVAARYELTDPAGQTSTVLDVPRYDFNWQLPYMYREPRDVKAGSRLRFTGWFDNSENNPHNPDPSKTVRFGDQTEDEMLIGYVFYYIPGQKPGELPEWMQPARRRPAGGGTAGVDAVFRRLDRDRDGFVTAAEAGAMWDRVSGADSNGDGKISLEEARAAFGG